MLLRREIFRYDMGKIKLFSSNSNLIKCTFTVIIYILCISNRNSLIDTDFQNVNSPTIQ